MEEFSFSFKLIESIGVLAVFVALLFEIKKYHRELLKQRKVLGFESYQRITKAYQELMWKAVEDSELDQVWVPIPQERQKLLDLCVRKGELWGVWNSMNPLERKCYRFTRSSLELLEQAWQVHSHGWIDEATWSKWNGWAAAWKATGYIDYVLAECECQNVYLSEFRAWLETISEPT